MTAPIYGDWIAHNATPDSTCPPDAVGKRGQVQLADQTRIAAELEHANNLAVWNWHCPSSPTRITAYRILIEPVRGEVVLYGDNPPECGWTFGTVPLASDTHTLRLPTLDGALIPGEYIGPDGAVIKVEVV